MHFSKYENIEIFINTQRFGINKFDNQIFTLTLPEYISDEAVIEFVIQ